MFHGCVSEEAVNSCLSLAMVERPSVHCRKRKPGPIFFRWYRSLSVPKSKPLRLDQIQLLQSYLGYNLRQYFNYPTGIEGDNLCTGIDGSMRRAKSFFWLKYSAWQLDNVLSREIGAALKRKYCSGTDLPSSFIPQHARPSHQNGCCTV